MAVNTSSESYIRNKDKAAKGMQDIKKQLEAKLREAATLTEEGLDDVLDEIKKESLARTPIDTKVLYDSCFTEKVKQGDKVIGVVGYDRNGEAPYSSYVHEINANHPVGQWKFLLAGANVVEARIPSILQKSLNKMFQKTKA